MKIRPAVLLVALASAGCVPAIRDVPSAASVAPPLSWRDGPAGLNAIDPRWWRAYGDPGLDGLVEQALRRNTDVLTAIAVVDESRAQARLARSGLFPTLAAIGNAQASHQPSPAGQAAGKSAPDVTETVQAGGLSVWEIDLFGRTRALSAAARDRYVASRTDRDAVSLAVARQTVEAYVGLLALDAQIALTEDTARSRLATVALENERLDYGYDSRQESLQAQSEYEAVAGQLPAQQLAQRRQENALAVLTGEAPHAVARAKSLLALRLPSVPSALPSELLRRRPDIASAEYRLSASDATIAASRAAFLPQVTLTSEFLGVLSSATRFDPQTLWSAGNGLVTPLVQIPLFQGGRLRAGLDVAVAGRDQAAFAYKATVLKAFREVEDALAGVRRLGEQSAALVRRIDIARQSLEVLNDRFGEGYGDFLSVLDAQRTLFAAQQAEISARGDQLTNAANLAAALGGGWTMEGIRNASEGGSEHAFQLQPRPDDHGTAQATR